MPFASIVLILIASIFHVLRTLMVKTSYEKLLFVWWMTLFSFLILSPLCLYFFIKTKPDPIMIVFSAGMGFVHASYWISYARAYEKGDMSHVYPIIHSAPALILLFGIVFLNERPSFSGVLGILLISAGLYTINLRRLNLKTIRAPLIGIFEERHTRFAFMALLFVTTYSLLDKVAVSHIHPLAYNLVMTSSALGIFSVFIRKDLKKDWLKPMKLERKKVLAGALFASINYPLTLFALQLTSASYVSGFRQINVVLATLGGYFLLKEKITLLRSAAILLIFSGAVLVAMA